MSQHTDRLAGAEREPAPPSDVLRCGELAQGTLEDVLARGELDVVWVADRQAIPGSYWGEPEAGIVGSALYVRADTPVHSALHEACHLLCMDAERRARVDRDAGGDELEEGAACYLQVLLADRLPGVGSKRLFADMDAWGYSFRTGSARRWFEEDAEDARAWLEERGILRGLDLASASAAARAKSTSSAVTVPRRPCGSN